MCKDHTENLTNFRLRLKRKYEYILVTLTIKFPFELIRCKLNSVVANP